MRTLLFDIDGTLLLTHHSGGGALKQAMEHLFADQLGEKEAKMDLQFGGRTDRSILVELLEKNAIPPSPENQEILRSCYVDLLPDVLKNRGGKLLPGVTELLERVSRLSEVTEYVMTGNLVQTAQMKLDHFGLTHYFRAIFGGDHDHYRNDLARRAVSTLATQHGKQSTRDMIVIGDTVADILCGHAVGAKVVAVATGSDSREQLEEHSPYAVVDDLSDTSHVLDILTG